MSKAIVINLYGAPGAGKSTGAAYIFSKLKLANINCELVTEFAKDKVYEKTEKVFQNQAYIFGKQYFRITRIEDEVDIIVTDSPLILSKFYNKNKDLDQSGFGNMVSNIHSNYISVNVFLSRAKKYNPSGRFQTEEESDQLELEMKDFLSKEKIEPIFIRGLADDYDGIAEFVIENYKEWLSDLEKMNEKEEDQKRLERIMKEIRTIDKNYGADGLSKEDKDKLNRIDRVCSVIDNINKVSRSDLSIQANMLKDFARKNSIPIITATQSTKKYLHIGDLWREMLQSIVKDLNLTSHIETKWCYGVGSIPITDKFDTIIGKDIKTDITVAMLRVYMEKFIKRCDIDSRGDTFSICINPVIPRARLDGFVRHNMVEVYQSLTTEANRRQYPTLSAITVHVNRDGTLTIPKQTITITCSNHDR